MQAGDKQLLSRYTFHTTTLCRSPTAWLLAVTNNSTAAETQNPKSVATSSEPIMAYVFLLKASSLKQNICWLNLLQENTMLW
jgi:hypothetical protein